MVSDVTDRKALETAVRKRKKQAFRPGTTKNHRRQFKLYLAFCLHYHLTDVNPSAHTLCLYVEFLARTFVSPQTIKKYISVIRLMHKCIGLNIPDSLNSFELGLMLRALDITSMHQPGQKQPLTLNMLKDICYLCDSIGNTGRVYKFAFLLSFYGVLRQSTLALKSQKDFDIKRHTCRGDVILHPPGLIVVLKWTKTQQTGAFNQAIPLPAIPKDPLCPVAAFKAMLLVSPTISPNDPPPLVAGSFKKHSDRRQTENSFPSPY